MSKHVLLFLLVFYTALHAQDTILLKQIEIEERSSSFIKEHSGISFDSLTLSKFRSRTLADLLSENTPAFIKSYGSGILSTTSIRGTSSVHTSVLWNGIPVNLQSTGDLDLSVISPGMFSRIKLIHGGSSSLFGSGSVGANILLNGDPSFGKGYHVSFLNSTGSFGRRDHSVSLKSSGENVSVHVNAFLKEHKNSFSYINHTLPGNPETLMKDSEISGKGVSASLFVKHKRSTFAIRNWSELFEREIPASAFSANPYAANQTDRNIRTMGDYKHVGNKSVLNVKAALMTMQLTYIDTLTKVNSDTRSLILFPEISLTNDLKHGKLVTGINGSMCNSTNTNYSGRKTRNNLAFFSGYVIPFKKTEISIHAREDLYDGGLNAFTFNSTLNAKMFRHTSVSITGGKSFRAPSLNDLYWIPGGNPDLRPERGWFAQSGATFNRSYGSHNLKATFTGYTNLIDDWIIWLPVSSTIWTPRNLKKVWSKGIEAYVSDKIRFGEWQVDLTGSYAYTEATNESSEDPGIVLHDQIIYVPYYTANISADLTYRNTGMRYAHGFTGGRYIASDHTAALPYYHTATLRIDHQLKLRTHSADLFVMISNLFDLSYQVVENRPMPGRGYEFGISINLNKY